MTINYYSVNGQIIGEKSAGQVRTDYMVDPLGDVIGTTNKDNSVNRAYRYKPFGALLASSGTGSDPRFRHVGAHGIRDTARVNAEEYMRARHYSNRSGAFTTVDPVPEPEARFEAPYIYVRQNPTTHIDPSGMQPRKHGHLDLSKCKKLSRGACYRCAYNELRGFGYGPYAACEVAKKYCGSNIKCGPCGHYSVDLDDWYTGCNLWELNHNFGNWLRHHCGGGGADKLAHCFMACMIQLCFGLVGSGLQMGEPDEEGDKDAEALGADCGINAQTCNLLPRIPYRSCWDCCVEKTKNLDFDLAGPARR